MKRYNLKSNKFFSNDLGYNYHWFPKEKYLEMPTKYHIINILRFYINNLYVSEIIFQRKLDLRRSLITTEEFIIPLSADSMV